MSDTILEKLRVYFDRASPPRTIHSADALIAWLHVEGLTIVTLDRMREAVNEVQDECDKLLDAVAIEARLEARDAIAAYVSSLNTVVGTDYELVDMIRALTDDQLRPKKDG